MPELPDLYSRIQDFIADTRADILAARADGKLTFSEGGQIVYRSTRRLVAMAAALDVTGAEKKKLVMDAVDKIYASVIAPLDLPYVPEPFESMVIDPLVGKVIHEVASGLVEEFVKELPQFA
jgi:hypothetical protein